MKFMMSDAPLMPSGFFPESGFWQQLPPHGTVAAALSELDRWLRHSDACGKGVVEPLAAAGAAFLLSLPRQAPTSWHTDHPMGWSGLEAGDERWVMLRLAASHAGNFTPGPELSTGLAFSLRRWLSPDFGLSSSAWQTVADYGVWMVRSACRAGAPVPTHAARDALLACLADALPPSCQRFLLGRLTLYWQFLAADGHATGEVLYGLDLLQRLSTGISPLSATAGEHYIRLWTTAIRHLPEQGLLRASLREVLETAPPALYRYLPSEAGELALEVFPRRMMHLSAGPLLPALLRAGSPLAATMVEECQQILAGLTTWAGSLPAHTVLRRQWQQFLTDLSTHEVWGAAARTALQHLTPTIPELRHVALQNPRPHFGY